MNALFDYAQWLPLIDESKVERVVFAKRIGQVMAKGGEGEDMNMLNVLARDLCTDEVEAVRSALSFELRRAANIEPDIAELIVFDHNDVAIPFLQTCSALEEELLLKVIEKSNDEAQVAIARRVELSTAVIEALAQYGQERAASSLARNHGLTLSLNACRYLLERFPESPTIIAELLTREDLPDEITTQLRKRLPSQERARPEGKVTTPRPHDKHYEADLPFAVKSAKIRMKSRMGELGAKDIFDIVKAEGQEGLEVVFTALLNAPHHKISSILNSDNEELISAMFRKAKMDQKFQSRLLELIKNRQE